jgi:dTDP-4-amino-4,6-dideoxygalactose transaminase
MRPRLPDAARLLPYLNRIDTARTYTNWGPLVDELEARLAQHFGLAKGRFVSASSGTAALVGAILATAGRARAKRTRALLPAYTFIGTASAAEQCGYVPLLADVDEASWSLDPVLAARHPQLDEIGVVVPVAPFGRAFPQRDWETFRERTGIPVVIDGAAALEAMELEPGACIGGVPVALSFHATKSFGCGEGGAVVCADPSVIRETLRALNFGFLDSRNSGSASINGKLSEYHAAVGLAELDAWRDKRAALLEVAARYREGFAREKLTMQFAGAPDIASCYALFVARDVMQAKRIQDALSAQRIDFRLWYGNGLHSQDYFRGLPHGPLPVTTALSPRVIGLPVACDLVPATIDRIVSVTAAAARG